MRTAHRAASSLLLVVSVAWSPPSRALAVEWAEDWETAPGFSLAIDSEGFHHPTSIAVVPDPGPDPKDPLYFVTELGGALKVVTNDRSVFTFAEGFFELDLGAELPDLRAEAGLGAVCIDPERGYVFVSFAYHDDDGKMHNGIVRFSSTPGTFSLAPTGSTRLAEFLAEFPSSRSHQIGHMAVVDGLLYVSVGDALHRGTSRDIDVPLGKVLRMTLDGRSVEDNPFFTPGADRPRDYVWAYGLRNPFGLIAVGRKLFAADNGPAVDRFVAIERGRDYGWRASDWSMGTNALAVFAPSVSPVQVAWLPAESTLFPPPYRRSFYIALSGSPVMPPGPGRRGEKSVVFLPFDLETGRVRQHATPVLRYRGDDRQMPVGVAFGRDALYVVPLFPVRDGTSAILALRHEPSAEHPHVIERGASATDLIASRGCESCHGAYRFNAVGPSLEPRRLVSRLAERLESPEYARSLEEIDRLAFEPQASYREERRGVAEATGKEKIRLWLTYRLVEPLFDRRESMMPSQDLTLEEAAVIADYFVLRGWRDERASAAEPRGGLRQQLPRLRYRHLVAAYLLGLATFGVVAVRRRRR